MKSTEAYSNASGIKTVENQTFHKNWKWKTKEFDYMEFLNFCIMETTMSQVTKEATQLEEIWFVATCEAINSKIASKVDIKMTTQ